MSGRDYPVAVARPRRHRVLVSSEPPIFQHPLAYLAGLEGVSLMRAFAGEYDAELTQAFTEARLEELRDLLANADRFGDGVVVPPLTSADAYDGWAPSYDGPNTLFDFEEPALLPILDSLPPGDALDVACGTGRITSYLAAHGHRVSGYDSSPGMVAMARDKLPEIPFAVADVRDLPVPDGSADLVVCTLALAHVPDLDPVFAEVARVLRPAGSFVVSDSRGQFIGSDRYPLPQRAPDGRLGYLPTWRHSIGTYLRAALRHGFEVLACEEPVRPPLDEDDWDPPSPPGPTEPPNVWDLMGFTPEAARATYLGTSAVVVWHFRLRDA
jgi:SAM-dependent methyltransferase